MQTGRFLRVFLTISERIDSLLIDSGATIQDYLRFKQFLVFCLFGIPTMLIFSIYNYFTGNFTLVSIILISALSLVAGAAYQIRNPGGMAAYRLCGAVYCVLLLYMFILGGADGSKSLWLLTFPLIAFFLLGKKEGFVWTAVLLLLVFWMAGYTDQMLDTYPYSDQYLIRLVMVYVMIAGISGWFEHFRSSYFRLNQQGIEKFQEIMENSRDILYRRDLNSGEYEYISKAFFDLLGFSRNDKEGQGLEGVESLIHPEDRERHNEHVSDVLHTSRKFTSDSEIEYRMRDKKGRYRWFSDRMTVVFDKAGNADHVIGVNREITHIRKTRMALEKSQEQLHTILNSIDAHVYVANMKDHRILFMNEKMQKDFGGNLEGGICWREFRNIDGPCDHCSNNLLLDTSGSPTGVHEWQSYNPVVKRWYTNYDRAIQWGDGSWVRLQIAVDITKTMEMEEERKKNEETLRRAGHLEAIGNLAGGIAHDLNNLLQIVDGNLSLLEDDEMLSASGWRKINEIQKASTKASELAARLITFAPGGNPIKKPRDISPLLHEIIEQEAAKFHMQHNLVIEPDIWQVMADSKQLKVALSGLVKNSCESMEPGGLIGISVRNHVEEKSAVNHDITVKEGKYVKLIIRDNGRGIAEEELPRIFEPYYSTKQMSSEKGVGLGLSIAYSVIKKHDGYINVSSEPGMGTSVFVYLPAEIVK